MAGCCGQGVGSVKGLSYFNRHGKLGDVADASGNVPMTASDAIAAVANAPSNVVVDASQGVVVPPAGAIPPGPPASAPPPPPPAPKKSHAGAVVFAGAAAFGLWKLLKG